MPVGNPRLAAVVCAATLATLTPLATAHAAPAPDPTKATLTGWSVLPTKTYDPGTEASGFWTTGNAHIPAPYPAQPIQGFSGTQRLADGTYLAISDNGFGVKANSADFQLAVHHIAPNTATERTAYLGTTHLSDPKRLVPWTLWRDGACDPATAVQPGYTCPAPDRILTGWDFDVESFQVARDGTWWFGDEFGPYLLHTNADGVLLQAPIRTPGVKSLSNPEVLAGTATANLRNSKGFEGLAISPNGKTLYPLLEGATDEDIKAGLGSDLRIYTVRRGTFKPGFRRYRLENPEHAIGDFILINSHQGLVIERDNGHGPAAVFKRIYLVDLDDRNGDGYVDKSLLVNLMHVANPKHLGGFGDVFTFPYFTIEDLDIVDADTIAVMNDNNFPATGARVPEVPDWNEYLEITLGRPLKVDRRLLAH